MYFAGHWDEKDQNWWLVDVRMMLGHFPMVHVLFSVYALKATQIKISLKHQHIPVNIFTSQLIRTENMLLNMFCCFSISCFIQFLHPFCVNSPLLFYKYKLEQIQQIKMEFIWKFSRRLFTCGVRGFGVLSIL